MEKEETPKLHSREPQSKSTYEFDLCSGFPRQLLDRALGTAHELSRSQFGRTYDHFRPTGYLLWDSKERAASLIGLQVARKEP